LEKYNLSSLKKGEITKAKLGRVRMTVFGQSGEFRELFFLHLDSWSPLSRHPSGSLRQE